MRKLHSLTAALREFAYRTRAKPIINKNAREMLFLFILLSPRPLEGILSFVRPPLVQFSPL